MIARMKARWVMLSARERLLISVMLGLLAAVLGWYGIARPVGDALASARAGHRIAVDRNGRILATVAALRRERGAAAILSGKLDQIVGQEAAEAGFTLESSQMAGPDRMTVSLPSARPNALFAWLGRLEAKGVAVESLTVTPGAAGTVAARASLRAAR